MRGINAPQLRGDARTRLMQFDKHPSPSIKARAAKDPLCFHQNVIDHVPLFIKEFLLMLPEPLEFDLKTSMDVVNKYVWE